MYYGTADPWMQAAPEFYELGEEVITNDANGHLQSYANPFGPGSPMAYTLDPGTVTTAPTSSRRAANYHQHLQQQLQHQQQHQHQHQQQLMHPMHPQAAAPPQQTYFAPGQPPQLWASPRSSSSDDDSSSSSSSPPQSPKLVLRERERKLSYQPAAIGMYSRSNRSPTAARASVGGRPRNFTTGGVEMRQQFAPLRSWVSEDQHNRHNPASVAKTPTKGASSPKVGRSPKAGRSSRAGASKKSTKEVKQFLEAPLRPGTNLINKGQFAEVPMMLCDRSPTAQDASPSSSLTHIAAFRRANAERGPGLPTAPYPPSPFIVPSTHLPPKPSGGAW